MRGTDVHPVYQRGIRWDQVSDINFVWVKVSDGGSPYVGTSGGVRYVPDTHVAGAKSRGIPVGGYHYAELSPAPEAQADVLIGEVRRLGALGVAPMLDLEAPFTANAAARSFGIAFCNRVLAAGLQPAVYMSASFARVLRPDQWSIPGLVIVIARYGARPEAAGSAQYLGRYDVHQYQRDGALPGSTGEVDFDESYTTNLLNPEEDDMAWTEADFNTPLFTDATGTPQQKTVRFRDWAGELRTNLAGLVASNAALTTTLAQVANHPDATPDQIKQWVEDAVAQHVQITGTVQIGPAS